MKSIGLEELLRRKREKDEKKKEKERIKNEQKAKKIQEKKKERKKKLKKIQNQKYYKKVKDEREKYRKEKGDKRAYHMIVIMKNYKKKKRLAFTWWMTDAFEKYNQYIEENRKNVRYPIKISETNEKKQKKGIKSTNTLYEIMILQKTNDEQYHAKFRNEYGKFVDNVIIDNSDYNIIAKDEWYVEETFHVYGYHPIKDRKTFDFILNEIILKDNNKENIKRVFTYKNKLIIQYNNDIDMVSCKTAGEAKRLYAALDKSVSDKKYILFTGSLCTKNMSTWVLNKMEEKTGWTRNSCYRSNLL